MSRASPSTPLASATAPAWTKQARSTPWCSNEVEALRPALTLLTIVALVASACTSTRYGSIYSPSTATRGQVVFPDSLRNHGTMSVTLTDGERCDGRYATVPGPRVTWEDEEPFTIKAEDTQDGMSVLNCKNGHLLRCNLSRDITGDGMGQCVDNRGQQFLMYF